MPLSSLMVTIDTREKDVKRINAISTFFEKHGAVVERNTLNLCDYHIEGSFRDKEINLGIEGKTLVDFSQSYQDLPHKLLKSYELYDHVGLIVETGAYGFTVGHDGLLCTIKNPSVPDGKADILQ
ncbi:MAG: ERCC4 domain-containing protein, partial [Candidatus Izemoplasmatales bacterium]|nr:ERCC4 domain-containing protein [Candidatus Izemoplasmatales bacterium]